MSEAQEAVDFILRDRDRITDAITLGAAWEIWMQVELGLIFKQKGFQAARELQYPDNSHLHLDLAIRDRQGNTYAIELKVESANRSGGSTLVRGLEDDVKKIQDYSIQGLSARWVIGIAYSADARFALQQIAQSEPKATVIDTLESITVLLIEVDRLGGGTGSTDSFGSSDSSACGSFGAAASAGFASTDPFAAGAFPARDFGSDIDPSRSSGTSQPTFPDFPVPPDEAWAEQIAEQMRKAIEEHGSKPQDMFAALFGIEDALLDHLHGQAQDSDLPESDAADLVDTAEDWRTRAKKAGQRMADMAEHAAKRARSDKVEIRLPADQLRWLDEQVTQGRFPNRDTALRRHIDGLRRRQNLSGRLENLRSKLRGRRGDLRRARAE